MNTQKMTEKELFNVVAEIQKNAAGRVITRSTNGKLQQRSTGERKVRNLFNHAVGTIGADIDNIVRHDGLSGRFSIAEIAALTGTKLSKVRSHLNNECRKKYGLIYRVNENGKLTFEFPAGSRGKQLLSTTKNYRFK
jgi:hypothetical protein